MGVPKFFRWVAERYPLVITPFQDSPPPVDNLYLDMNGIIHHCTHPNDVDASRKSLTEQEMVAAMFAYLEKLFQAIRPSKHFFLAVDGCAPRAKMNQQRQRRYRSGYELMVAREEALKQGLEIPEEGDVFDSNCITPGTEFMVRVSEHFKYFIAMKIQQDSAWRNCKVIFSGHDVPGEGEHKIVDFIRRRKMQPGYSPNETHCMYGLDADLIMLALATHEPNFILLREVVSFSQPSMKEKARIAEDEAKGIKEAGEFGKPDTFVLFHVKILREYLDKDVRRGNNFPNYNLERVIDDFVFMCVFIGNDFMPSIPTIGINDGSLVVMMDIYREHVLSKGTTLLRGNKPNWNAVDVFLAKLGELELDTLRARQDEELEFEKRRAKMDASREAPIQSLPIGSIAEYKEKYYREKHGFAGGWDPRGQELFDLKQHYVEGLMWVLEYYYQGPPSWKWYFPHHYAPMASDLVNLTVHGTNVKFEAGQPFLPHQQLLAVLPPMSYRSMPKAYWPLLRSASSPLNKYFPPHLEIDREGSRAPWEGIVLIPFIDERVLLAAYHSVQSQTTDEDKERNRQGLAVLFEYDGDLPPYTLFNDMFGNVQTMRVRRTAYEMPEMKTPFVPALCTNVRVGTEYIEGYGSLAAHDADTTVTFEQGAVSIFGRPSRKESLLLSFQEGEAQTADDVVYLIGQEVWINYPHYKRGRVCCVTDRKKRVSAQWDKEGNFQTTLSENLTAEEYRAFRRETDLHQQFLKSKCGIVISNIDVLIYVNRFTGMRISRKGRFLRQWSRKETCYPLQLVSPGPRIDILEDARNKERDRDQGDFEGVQQVMYIGPDPKAHKGESVTGCIGAVLETQRNNAEDFSTLLIRSFTRPQPVPASLIRATKSENWMTMQQLTDTLRKELEMPTLTSMAVSQICGSLTTSAQWGSNELGLCLKFTAKNLARVGLAKLVATQYNPWWVGNGDLFAGMEDGDIGHYMEAAQAEQRGGRGGKGGQSAPAPSASHDKGQWYFSVEAYYLIAEYCKNFKPLLHRIVAGGHNYMSFDMAGVLTNEWQTQDPEAVMQLILKWLDDRGVHRLPMIAATDDAFTKDVVADLEAALEQTTPRPVVDIKLRRVLSRHIHYPSSRAADGSVVSVPLPTREQKYTIGNRVVYARNTGIVPFGATGIIVRLLGDGKTADVVFDEPFVGGSHLGGRLKTPRGGLCKLAALLVVSAAPSVAFDPEHPDAGLTQEASTAWESPAPSASSPTASPTTPPVVTTTPHVKAPAAAAPAPVVKKVMPAQQQQQQQQQQQPPVIVARVPMWNRNPPKQTPAGVRNAFMGKVSQLLAARFGNTKGAAQ